MPDARVWDKRHDDRMGMDTLEKRGGKNEIG
jgi:hypothetical protein